MWLSDLKGCSTLMLTGVTRHTDTITTPVLFGEIESLVVRWYFGVWLKLRSRKFSRRVNAGHKSATQWIIEEQSFGERPTHEQRAVYISLCTGDALWDPCRPLWHCNHNFCLPFKCFLYPFLFLLLSPSLFLFCWSQLEASQVGLGQ